MIVDIMNNGIKLDLKESHNIKEAFWDVENKILKIIFNSNIEYGYYDLDEKVVMNGLKAESTGKYFNQYIKNAKYKRIN